MSWQIFEANEDLEIRPEDFKVLNFPSAFGKSETENAAATIVTLCQKKGGWKPFTLKEVKLVHRKLNKKGEFNFCGLVDRWDNELSNQYPVGGGWIVKINGKYYITDSFVFRLATSLLRYHCK